MLHMMLICFSDQGSGFCVTGKIEAGYVQTGDRLLAMPPNETCTAKGMAGMQHASASRSETADLFFSSLVIIPE